MATLILIMRTRRDDTPRFYSPFQASKLVSSMRDGYMLRPWRPERRDLTFASLGLGWAGEDTVYQLLRGILESSHIPVSPVVLHGIGFALAFLVISYAHVIIGEVVPKNLAIEKADRMAVLAAPALLVFYRLSQPFVIVIERSSALVLRIFGLRAGHARGGHTPEELKYIVQSSRHA